MISGKQLQYPAFQVNFKIYPNTSGEQGLRLARLVEDVKHGTGAEFLLSPQIPDIRLIATKTDLPIVSQYVDAVQPGRGMGRILPETLCEAGVSGVMMNHPERRDLMIDLEVKIQRCREVGLASIVCVDSLDTLHAAMSFDPDAVLCEKPEDIGGERPITLHRPEYVKEFIQTVHEVDATIPVWVGGGINSAEAVQRAFELGADAVGAASAVSLAEDPRELLEAIGEAMP